MKETSAALNGYLPLSGGELKSSNLPLYINRESNTVSSIGYKVQGVTMGILGFDQLGNLTTRPNFQTNTNYYNVWHEGNFTPSNYLPLSGGTISSSNYATQLRINRTDAAGASVVRFSNSIDGIVGDIGIGGSASGVGVNPLFQDKNGNVYKIWHKGNDGSGSGLDADLLDGVQLSGLFTGLSSSVDTNLSITVGGVTKSISNLVAYRTSIFRRIATATADNKYDLNGLIRGMAYSYSLSSALINRPSGMFYGQVLALNSGDSQSLCGQLAWDVNHGSTTDVTRRLWWRAGDSSNGFTYAQWHQIAFTDSNVASATKLLTTRYIWGQPFDGTGNVTGDLILQSTSASADTPKIYFQRGTTADTYYDNYIYNTGGGITFGYSSGGTNYDLCKLTSTTLRPNSSGTYDLGASDYLWKTLWASYAKISSIYIGDDLLFMNRGGKGIYLTGSGINYHDSSNAWVASCLGFDSSGDAKFRHKILLPTTGSSAFTTPQILLGDGIARIGVASSGFMGIYAKTSIRLSQDSETEASSTGLWVYTGGYVGINKSAPTATLDVNGTANISGAVTVGSTLTGNYWYLNNSSTNPYLRLTRSSVNWYVQLAAAGLALGQGIANSCTIDASGNFLSVGGITQYSDIRKKTKLQDVELTLKQVADAPLIEHYYNSDDKKTTHVGSIAQYWADMNDWFCKLDSDGYYTMEIQNAALASAISIARELERYESKTDKKIRLLKKRINELEDEIEKLKNVA